MIILKLLPFQRRFEKLTINNLKNLLGVGPEMWDNGKLRNRVMNRLGSFLIEPENGKKLEQLNV